MTNSNIKVSDINKMVKNVENAIGKTLNDAKQKQIADRKHYADPKNVKEYKPNELQKDSSKPSSVGKQKIQGYKMVEEKIIDHQKTDKKGEEKQKGVEWFVPLIIGLMSSCIIAGGVIRFKNIH
ncbi:MAG: hypothetical protein Q4A00_04625 [Flavobacteriaceae bacterium]|nr:hypothetical protein [Flavobacteriaceae bacterium]